MFLGAAVPTVFLLHALDVGGEFRIFIALGVGAIATAAVQSRNPPVLPKRRVLDFSAADRDICRLDALACLLPNPDLFVAMHVRHEAVLSWQIQGRR